MVAEITSIQVIPSFAIVNGETRPILTVIGGKEEAAELREWFDKARGQGKIPAFLWTQQQGEDSLKGKDIEAKFVPTMRVRCNSKDCMNLTSLADGYCELHTQEVISSVD